MPALRVRGDWLQDTAEYIVCGSGSCSTPWLRLVVDSFRTRVR
jgi:hypothetical protein